MKFKRLISGVIVAAVCTLCVFNLVACGEKNSGKDTPVYYTVTFYCNLGLEEDSVQKQVETGKTAADKVPDVMIKTVDNFEPLALCTLETNLRQSLVFIQTRRMRR